MKGCILVILVVAYVGVQIINSRLPMNSNIQKSCKFLPCYSIGTMIRFDLYFTYRLDIG